jgi:hypothetical protein
MNNIHEPNTPKQWHGDRPMTMVGDCNTVRLTAPPRPLHATGPITWDHGSWPIAALCSRCIGGPFNACSRPRTSWARLAVKHGRSERGFDFVQTQSSDWAYRAFIYSERPRTCSSLMFVDLPTNSNPLPTVLRYQAVPSLILRPRMDGSEK